MALDFLAGYIGGCAGVLVGHPLDTIKVRIQAQDPKNPTYTGVWHCLKTIIAEEKVSGLYKGMTSPMIGIGLVNAIVFGIYGNIQRQTEDPNALYSHFLAGSVAGFFQSIVCSPMELVKTRMQLQRGMDNDLKYKGPIHCFRHIYRNEGLRGTFRGLGITAIRDVPAFAAYFVSYEYMMRIPSNPNAMHSLIAGGFAGIFSWLTCYPIDVIKTVLQADGMTSEPQYHGIWDCMQKGYRQDGLHFFLRGLTSTMIRAFPMNAACFFVVSCILKVTQGTNIDLVVNSGKPIAVSVNLPLYHVPSYECYKKNNQKRCILTRNLKAIGGFHEAVCMTEVEELANEIYPEDTIYFVYENERLDIIEVSNINLKRIAFSIPAEQK